MKINWLKLLGLIILNVFVIAVVKEVRFNPDFYLSSFIIEGLFYSYKHPSFLSILGGLGMLLIVIGVTGTTKQKIAVGFGNGYLESFLQ